MSASELSFFSGVFVPGLVGGARVVVFLLLRELLEFGEHEL